MNQKLSSWASIAEIISGAAVVITLVFLIIGINENTNTMRASAYADLLDGLNRFQTEMMTDPASVSVWRAFIEGEAAELEGDDRMRLNLAVLTIFRLYESAYYSDEYGLLGTSERERLDRNICAQFARVRSANAEILLRDAMTTDFLRDIETELCVD